MPIGGIPFGTSDIAGSGEMGITELTGDVTAGPGSGSQVATIGPLKVTTPKINDNAVTPPKIATGAVTTPKLFDGAVTLPKIADVGADVYLGAIVAGQVQQLPMTAAGRAMNAAADVAAQQVILGIKDITDYRNYAIQRARQIFAAAGRGDTVEVAVEESFVNRVSQASGGNPTSQNFFTGLATNSQVNEPGGWKQIKAGELAGNSNAWSNNDYAQAVVVPNVNTCPWYQLWIFQIDTIVVEAQTQVQLGWIDNGFAVQQPLCGVQGAGSLTKFRFFDGTAGVDSDVNITSGDAPHIVEMWGGLGDSKVYGSFDFEATKSYTTAKTNKVTPFIQVVRDVVSDTVVDLGHFVAVTLATRFAFP